MASCHSVKWEMDYGSVMGGVCARLLFAIIRTTLLCVRGSHTKWHVLGLVNGATILLLVSFPFVWFSILNCLVSMVFLCM